jgi:hypothetical protein
MTKKLSVFNIIFCFGLLLFCSGFSQVQAQDNTQPARILVKNQGWDAFMVKCLKELARDPGSVVTRNIRIVDNNYWIGQFNSRNGYGGMTGWVEFSFMLLINAQVPVIKIGEQIYYC